ncbi:hypothetical protein GCM10027299_03240 [Larkinella ripae]
MGTFQNQQTPGQNRPGALTLTIGAHTDWVPINQIVRIQGEGNYSRIHTQMGQEYLIAVTLLKVSQRLPGFWRVHKSHLVNPAYVDQIRKTQKQGRFILLTTGEEIPIARRFTIQL